MEFMTAVIVLMMGIMLLPFAFRVYSSNEAKREAMRQMMIEGDE